MKQIRLLLLMLALLAMGVTSISAQEQTSIRWTGVDASSLSDGTEVFLYNVGTGRFMIHGGDWGIQGRLFYNDTGKILKIYKDGDNYYFDTGQTTLKDGYPAKYLICNVPGQTCVDNNWVNNIDHSDNGTYTIIFDGNQYYPANTTNTTIRNWQFELVQSNDGTYTYYMRQTFGGNKYWMGAVYGDNWGNHDGDGYGYLISLSSSYDKATWSQLQRFDGNDKSTVKDRVSSVDNNKTPADYSETMVQIFNADTKVSIDDLYKWRIVTKEQLLATLESTDVGDGLSTNLSYLINDGGFERNDFSFFEGSNKEKDNGWVANRFTDDIYTTSSEGRYRYTWGDLDGEGTNANRTLNQSGTRTITGENYMTPVRLKAQFDAKYPSSCNYVGKVEAKFGYMEFEGVGTATTYITAPAAGVYRISAYGFYQGDHPNSACFFATTTNPASLSLADMNTNKVTKSATLNVITDYIKSNVGTFNPNKTGVIGAGCDFVYNKDPYYRELQITVNAGDKIYFGVVKTEATKSSRDATTNRPTVNYYHDTDWVGADQFDITYLGTGNPVWLDERYTDYLGIDEKGIHDNTEYNNRAIRLHRTFEIGQWNSFVYPMNLSAVQVRAAFGDKTQLAELLGPGNITKNTSIIDFKSIELPAEGAAIKAGHFYIIKPERDMITSTEDDPFESDKKRSYYSMGNATFTKADIPTSVSVVMCRNNDKNDQVYSHGTYFNNTEIPTGSYVLGKNKEGKYNMYHLTSPATSKGFRGWITDTNATQASAKRISINGIFDETTSIDGVPVVNKRSDNNVVYDLTGRKVGSVETMETLSKGIYVVNGKKWIVK